MTYAPARTVTFTTGHIRRVITPENLYAEMAGVHPNLDLQLNYAAAVCGIEVPWRWHMTYAARADERIAPALADPAYCKTWVEWYIATINEFEAKLLSDTGADLALKGFA